MRVCTSANVTKLVALKLVEIWLFFLYVLIFIFYHFLNKLTNFSFSWEISVPQPLTTFFNKEKKKKFKKKNREKGGSPTANKIALNWRLFKEQNSYLQHALIFKEKKSCFFFITKQPSEWNIATSFSPLLSTLVFPDLALLYLPAWRCKGQPQIKQGLLALCDSHFQK